MKERFLIIYSEPEKTYAFDIMLDEVEAAVARSARGQYINTDGNEEEALHLYSLLFNRGQQLVPALDEACVHEIDGPVTVVMFGAIL